MLRRIALIVAFAVTCFTSGAAAYKYNLIPLEQIRILRNGLAGDPLHSFLSVTEVKPRNTIFESFHPHADIVMIGDSNTQGAEWKEIFPGVSIANRGIGGDRSDDILRRLATALEVHPTKAFLMFGLNDFAIKQSVDAVFANYRSLVERLLAAQVQAYIQSTIECSRATCGEVLDQIRDLNGRLRAYAHENEITFIDLNRPLTSEKDGLLSQYTYDGTHLLGAGYQQWRAVIAPYVEGAAQAAR